MEMIKEILKNNYTDIVTYAFILFAGVGIGAGINDFINRLK